MATCKTKRPAQAANGTLPTITVPDAMALAGCSARTIRRWVVEGRLRATRARGTGSSRLLLHRGDLLRLLGIEDWAS